MSPLRPDVRLVTCKAHPNLPADDQPLVEALRRRGVRIEINQWDADEQLSAARLTVVRAAWNSHRDPPEFQRWLATVAAAGPLLNGASFLRWNFDKLYLMDLARRSVPVVPTTWLPSPDRSEIEQLLERLPQGDLVAKPRFGADAYGAARLERSAAATAIADHFESFGRAGGLLLQPYIASVDRERERSLVFVAGRFSHALYRSPFGRGPTSQAPANAHTPTDDELRLCRHLFAVIDRPLSYVRVDLIPLDDRPVLMELEGIDPSLFFTAEPSAAEVLADEIVARLNEPAILPHSSPAHVADRLPR